jgi:methylase of polypeptide subunit release factors
MFKAVRYKDITVSYLSRLDGGGMGFGQEFIRVAREKIGKVDHIFEFCSGPGFIGFSLLAHNLCEKLTLADVNPDAVTVCKETISKNNLQGRVSVYLSDCLDQVPEDEKWDLVVGNPPHWPSSDEKYHEDITMFDPDLIIHKKFYKDIHKFLKPNGSVLLQENERATSAENFTQMIRGNGLEIIDVFKAKPLSLFECVLKGRKISRDTKPSPFYYIWSRVK